MKKILLVKLSSMGDLIQTLPALTDAMQAHPGIQFDWLVETSFQDIPRLHPAVNQIITLPYRRWKKEIGKTLRSGELLAFWKTLRNKKYDMVIDAQSNLKSAVAASLARGEKYGLDKQSVREKGAQLAYHHQIYVNRNQNHALRIRQLMASFLKYPCPETQADYGIIKNELPSVQFKCPEKFVFMVPIASCDNKLWPEPYWQEVIQAVLEAGYEIVLPWWSADEKARVLRLKNEHPKVHLLPSLSLHEKAAVMAKASAAVCLDTGLAHMAAALNVPNICLYGPADPAACGTMGKQQIHMRPQGPSCAPCKSKRCRYEGPSEYQPACLGTISAQRVIDAFRRLEL